MLFRNVPELAPELLRTAFGVELPEFEEMRVGSAELTALRPSTLRAELHQLAVGAQSELCGGLHVARHGQRGGSSGGRGGRVPELGLSPSLLYP